MRPKSNDAFNFRKRLAYYPEQKRLFHQNARRQLKQLAAALGLEPDALQQRRDRRYVEWLMHNGSLETGR